VQKNKNVAIMQAYFFPYIGYFQLVDEADVFVLYDKVTYRKFSWINRNRIKEKGSVDPVYITVPIKKASSNNLIEDIRISPNQEWKKKLKNLLFFNYKKADYFEEVYSDIIELIDYEEESLHLYNSNILIAICKRLGITTSIITSNDKHSSIEEHLKRNQGLKKDVKQHRVVDLCNLYNASGYLNPINGMDLYSFEFFKENAKDLGFVNTQEIKYQQFKPPFQKCLSIIDVLFHNGYEGTKQLLKKRNLITK